MGVNELDCGLLILASFWWQGNFDVSAVFSGLRVEDNVSGRYHAIGRNHGHHQFELI